jgi:hypothetical protein
VTDLGPYHALWAAKAVSILGPGAERAARFALRRAAEGGLLEELGVAAELARIATLANRESRKTYRKALLNAAELVEPGEFGRMIALAQAADRKPDPTPRGRAPRYTKGIPVARWPQPWCGLWGSATRRQNATYDDAGALGTLSPSWLDTIRKRLGLLFGFMDRTGWASADRATIEAFIAEREKEASSGTLYNDVAAIATGLQGMLDEAGSDLPEFAADAPAAPAEEAEFETGSERGERSEFLADPEPAPQAVEDEFGEAAQRRELARLEAEGGPLFWLWEKVAELKAAKTPKRNKLDYRVELAYVVALGLDLMDAADAMPFGVEAAIIYRTGLFIAMLGLRCVRLATILDTYLPQGVSKALPLHGWVDVANGFFYWPRTKNGRSLRTKIPRRLKDRVPRWIDYYRDALAGPGHAHAFWIEARDGGPFRANGARTAFQTALEARFEKRLWPHLMRDLNAAYVCEEMPERVEDMISELLGHIRRESAATYVAIASDIKAAVKYEAALAAELREAASF